MPDEPLITDRLAIADLFTRFALVLDEQRWDDLATIFHDDVALHSPRGGRLRGIQELADFLRRSEVEGEGTQHTHSDLLVDLNGDQAAVTANSIAYYFREGQSPHRIGGLRLTSTAARTRTGWRITEHEVRPLWIREA
ncbi:nuclear transport factor 2 family protein [Nocardiopsis alkaliphila]|uniref:nuclear transport factor 2 family protein n=1 Tax=Nocardiopsis alkaliphila TaxID=225762 RepID=UPI00034D83E4|nr:nuclear transport factor 2 family protein [Nocardiopsis alkaliphila]